ncbi:3-deoxy-manno-octulosonate cytidylyltransferase [Aegicerativicinus sediminis]|uniref:3-deoxy-manno-octulosonate cytidylyltransferase n=1 Tax=Aegicerativicinus sediminis TaxID=2893202 RepID=UPI001E4F3B59|nr:3-deoxy-manno-octulosonate cytidylyltransferase [Aegicerativicinus sediminis]
MRIIAMIPARYSASRFPGKLMQDLDGKPVIVRTFDATVATALFDAVYVVTDSEIIKETIEAAGGNVIMSKKSHESGSDRIAEAVEDLEIDIVVNVQGDEPFIEKESLEKVLGVFKTDFNKEIDLASIMVEMHRWEDISNPNIVKVIVDQNDFALYFSRSPIPYPRDKDAGARYFKHKGIYAFRKSALLDFAKLPMKFLEATEKIECIRYLEYGKKIKMVETTVEGIGIDTPEDLELARKQWK